jgi:hypothetical protein
MIKKERPVKTRNILNYIVAALSFAWSLVYMFGDKIFSLSPGEFNLTRVKLNVFAATVVIVVTLIERIKVMSEKERKDTAGETKITELNHLVIPYCLAIVPFSAAIVDFNREIPDTLVFTWYFLIVAFILTLETLLLLMFENDKWLKRPLCYHIITVLLFVVMALITTPTGFAFIYWLVSGCS